MSGAKNLDCLSDTGSLRLVCQQCGGEDTARQYALLDCSINPACKEALLDGGFFNWRCPHCGCYADIAYPSRYLDEQAGLSIVLHPGLEYGRVNAPLQEMNRRLEGLGMPGFIRRAVGTFFAMQELARVREERLDDRIVQLLKPLIIGQMQSAGLEVWNGFFTGIDDGSSDSTPQDDAMYVIEDGDSALAYAEPVMWFDIHLTSREVKRRGVNLAAYRLCEQMLLRSGAQEDDGWYHLYDLSWAITFHNQMQS